MKAIKKRRVLKKNFYDLAWYGITQSSLKVFMSCRRKWMFSIAGLERKNKHENTFFGTIVHEMLDQVYQNLDKLSKRTISSFIRRKLNKFMKKNKDSFFVSDSQRIMEKEMAVAIVEGYFKFFIKDKKNFKNIQPEYEFAIDYQGTTLRGKIDNILTLGSHLWQMEHKTKSRIDEEGLLQSLQFDFQNLMYSLVLDEVCDEPVKGVLYNVIRKPGLRQGKQEHPKLFLERIRGDIKKRPEWYFKRYEIVYSKKDKAKFKKQLEGVLLELKMFIKGRLPDIQNPAHCLTPFKCDYLKVCSEGSTHGLTLKDSLHPELNVAVEPLTEILKYYGLKCPKV